MHAHAETRSAGPKSRNSAEPSAPEKTARRTVPHRPAQRAADHTSPFQPAVTATAPVQLKTTIRHTRGTYTYHYPALATETVGTSMRAWLDPHDQVAGSDTGDNPGAQQALMTSVNHHVASAMVKGHLLNANLGGDAVPGNLYPITSQANALHKTKAEYGVKAAVTAGPGVEYHVDVVNAAHSDLNPNADFRCRAWRWNPAAWYGARGAELFNVTVQSRPNGLHGARGMADDNNNPGNVPGSFPLAANPAGWTTSAPNPAHDAARNRGRVSGLTGGGWCFITTAVAEQRGLPDDCHELTVLRTFRDAYLARTPGGGELIREYYAIAPRILTAIRRRPDEAEILAGLYASIHRCVGLIETQRPAAAIDVYRTMVLTLRHRYLR